MKKHWLYFLILLLLCGSMQAKPQGFFTMEEIADKIKSAFNTEIVSHIGDIIADDEHFNVFGQKIIDQVKQTDQYKNAPEAQQQLFLENMNQGFEEDRKQHTDNLINSIISLGERFTKLILDYPEIDYYSLEVYSIQYSTKQEMYGITIHENTIVSLFNEDYMIECNLPEVLEIDGGFILEKAPEFSVYRYGFSVDEIASEIARAFSLADYRVIDSLYVSDTQMQKLYDTYTASYRKGEQYLAYTDSQKAEFDKILEDGRSDLIYEVFKKKDQSEEAFNTVIFGNNYFDYTTFQVEMAAPGYVTVEEGVKSMNEVTVTISNNEYNIRIVLHELLSFGTQWKIVGTIDFTVEDKE